MLKILELIWRIARLFDIFCGTWQKYRDEKVNGELPSPKNGAKK